MSLERLRFTLAAGLLLAPVLAGAKGPARSFTLEGTIEISPGAGIRPDEFVLTGDLLVLDCRKQCEQTKWQEATRMTVKVRPTAGQFFAVSDPVLNAAAVREPETMFALLRDAAAHKHRTRLELVEPTLRLGRLGDVTVVEAQVARMLDFHLE